MAIFAAVLLDKVEALGIQLLFDKIEEPGLALTINYSAASWIPWFLCYYQ
jgi:hypothetical protein